MRELGCYTCDCLLKCTELESEPTNTASQVLWALLLPGLFSFMPSTLCTVCICSTGFLFNSYFSFGWVLLFLSTSKDTGWTSISNMTYNVEWMLNLNRVIQSGFFLSCNQQCQLQTQSTDFSPRKSLTGLTFMKHWLTHEIRDAAPLLSAV